MMIEVVCACAILRVRVCVCGAGDRVYPSNTRPLVDVTLAHKG